MAELGAARRREIRRRKILEGSEARLKKITCSISKLTDEDQIDTTIDEIRNNGHRNTENSSQCVYQKSSKYNLTVSGANNSSNEEPCEIACKENFNQLNEQLSGGDTSQNNKGIHRNSNLDSYTFPKKVSDAETRSFGKTRCDNRRNSTCTQIMMENFLFSSFSLTLLRPWIVSTVAILLRIYLQLTNILPAFQTIYFLFLMLELGFFTWSQLESQIFNRQEGDGPMMSSILLLCGFSEALISKFNFVWNIINYLIVDFSIYLFFFVFSHFICELC